jgi:hypothetical protein
LLSENSLISDSILIELDNFKMTGLTNQSTNIIDIKVKNELFNIIFDKNKSFDEIYHFLMNSFGPENMESLLNLLSRPFIEWIIEEKNSQSEKLFDVSYLVTEHSKLLESSMDPIILGISLVGKIRQLF